MILSVTFSKPSAEVKEILGKEYEKIKIKYQHSSNNATYFMEMFTQKQVFHKHLTESELQEFIQIHAGKTFKNCIQKTETEEITILTNKKGKTTTLTHKLPQSENTINPKTNLKILPEPKKITYCQKIPQFHF